MKRSVVWLFVLLCGCITFAKEGRTVSSVPDRFLIARHTFIDVGPPNDFYEIISVRGTSTGTTVERVTLIPPGDACIQPPEVETVASAIPEPVDVVLEGRNPCAISDKALRKELKRRKQGLVFSGAEISMHVQCAGKERIIRADVLDRDMFDPNAATPENTSWTMRLLTRLDRAFPSGVWDRPVFVGSTEPTDATVPNSDAARALASGTTTAFLLAHRTAPLTCIVRLRFRRQHQTFCSVPVSHFNRRNSLSRDIPRLQELRE